LNLGIVVAAVTMLSDPLAPSPPPHAFTTDNVNLIIIIVIISQPSIHLSSTADAVDAADTIIFVLIPSVGATTVCDKVGGAMQGRSPRGVRR
jgi:hypothetical protein